MTLGTDRTGEIYLVLLDEVVVAQDIAETITEFEPTSTVLIATTVEAAEAAVGQIDRIAVAFVSVGPQRFSSSNLAQSLAARGCRIVLLGDEAEEATGLQEWPVLQRPFGPDTLISHLRPPRPN